MKKTLSRSLVALLLAAAPLAAGCSSAEPDTQSPGDEQEVVASPDVAVVRALENALVGLETGGGEGDPDAYEVLAVKLARGEAFDDAMLLGKLLPKMIAPEDGSDYIPGLDEHDATEAWSEVTAEPDPADFDGDDEALEHARAQAAGWTKVKAIFDNRLTGVRRVDLGYRSSPDSSLETGEVAHVFVGRTSTGQIVAVWGIDIWT